MQPQFGQVTDEGLDVEFYEGSKPDDANSTPERMVFKPVVMVRIKIPGNRDEIIDDEAWLDDTKEHAHHRRFPHAWARFKSRQTAAVPQGFPLKDWAGLTRAAVDTLERVGIQTVEQLANVTDGNLQNVFLPNPTELRQRARDFLAHQNSAQSMRTELEALKAQLAAMSQPHVRVIPQAAEVQVFGPPAQGEPVDAAGLEAVNPPPRRRGRPPKHATP
jgi:hypothetical protein